MISFIVNLLITALVVFVCAKLMKGISVDGFSSACLVSLALAGLDYLVNWLFGQFGISFSSAWTSHLIVSVINLCINTGLIMIVSNWLDSFKVKNFVWALVLALVCAVVSSVIGGVFGAIS